MKKIITVVIILLSGVFPLFSQNETRDSTEIESMNEILISSQRLGESRFNTSRQIEVITGKQIELAQQPTMGEVLGQTGHVFVQKSQLGGGSVVMRGFEASRNLIVVDGVRMNNATYRAGHLQDIVTIDPFMLERTELYFGSGSTLYGSDALGGVIYLKTKKPEFTESFTFKPTALFRYASAGNSFTGNLGWNMGFKKIAWLFNFTENQFGDLTMGKGKNYSGIDTFGLRNYYVERVNNIDVIKTNEDPYVQKGTGYNQADIFTKIAVKHKHMISTLNFQASLNRGMPRYDRLTQLRTGKLRFAEWDYTPQNRLFASYTAELGKNENVSHRFITSWQQTEVGRATRDFNKPVRLTQLDKVNMYALNYDHNKMFSKKLKLQSGFEAVYNQVLSTAFNDSVNSGARLVSKASRYADSFANTTSISAFSNVVIEIKPGDFTMNAGFRLSQYAANAAFTKNNFWGLDYGIAKVRNVAPVFNLGMVKKLANGLIASVNLSTGFRNPNIDDLTKLFESQPGIKYIIPNTKLKAESTRTADVGLRYIVPEKLNIEAGIYYTTIKNLLIDQVSTFNGLDSINFLGQNTRVYRMENAAMGFVQGAYIGGKAKLAKNLYADGHYAATFGRYKANENASQAPLDHIAPNYGRIGLKYHIKDLRVEAFMLFNGWKLAKDYSPSGEDNVVQAPGGRTPSWQTYNIRGSYLLKKQYQFTLAIENVLDLNYRVFASGMSAPGRNIIASFRYTL